MPGFRVSQAHESIPTAVSHSGPWHRTVVEFISEPAISITVARDTTSNEKPLALQDYTRPKTFPSAVVRRHRAGVVVQQ